MAYTPLGLDYASTVPAIQNETGATVKVKEGGGERAIHCHSQLYYITLVLFQLQQIACSAGFSVALTSDGRVVTMGKAAPTLQLQLQLQLVPSLSKSIHI